MHIDTEENLLAEEIAGLRPYLLRSCRRYINDPNLIEDLVQDALIRGIEKSGSWKNSEGKLKNWMVTILRNICMDHHRAVKRDPINSTEELYGGIQEPPPDFDQQCDMERLLNAVEELPDRQIGIVKARLKGRKISDISEELKLNENTVRARIFRAKANLRKSLHV